MEDEYRYPWREIVRSLWFLPAVFVIGALVAGYGLSQVTLSDEGFFAPILFRGDATAARQLLTVVAGTMITVTGLVFVLTVVALQIASTQFSPRLLRSFLQDRGTRLVLSVFVATFAYSLGGLFTVGQDTAEGSEFVPQLAVTGSLILALLSVGMLVYYIQHITNAIRIDTVMHSVRRATLDAIRRHHPEPVTGRVRVPVVAPKPPEHAVLVAVRTSGYLQEVDAPALSRLAGELGITIRIRPQVGHHLVAGSTLAWAWRANGGGDLDVERVSRAVNDAVLMTVERRVESDIGFGIRQLVDIAMKAVAPSMNDPYTAVQAIQHLAIVMTELATVAIDDQWIGDESGEGVFVPVPKFELALDTVCSNVRRNAANRPRVLIALLRLLESVAAADTTPERREAVAHHVALIMHSAERAIPTPTDLDPIRQMAHDAAFAAEHGRVDHD